jgi:UDP-2,4-diacetamido-2,4,6-trideoxy-beta-L-altropyranose hydrolase
VLGDAELLRRWRNDAATRSQSFDPDEVAPDDHRKWLERQLAGSTTSRLLIGEVAGAPVGQARIERLDEDLGEISVSVDPSMRGRGLGVALIAAATERAATDLGLQCVRAVVKASNGASVAAFRRAGYACERTVEHRGEEVVVLEWSAR